MLTRLQPDHFLRRIGPLAVRDGDEVQVAPQRRLADDLGARVRRVVQLAEQFQQLRVRIRRDVREPNRAALGPEFQRGLLLHVIPHDGLAVLPRLAVVAEHGPECRPHRARARLVVVFAHPVRERQRQFAPGDVVHAEVKPSRLPVAPALVGLSLDVQAKRGVPELLNLPQRRALESLVERDGRKFLRVCARNG